jgi:hypothetical protein
MLMRVALVDPAAAGLLRDTFSFLLNAKSFSRRLHVSACNSDRGA